MTEEVTDKLVILAAGVSSRMKLPAQPPSAADEALFRQADERTKGMIGVGVDGRPFLDYLLYNCKEAGIRDVTMVVGRRDDVLKTYYGSAESSNQFHGLSISYAYQSIPPGRTKPLGTADALLQALHARQDWHGEKFLVCNSDNLYSIRAIRMLATSREANALIDYDREGLSFPAERIARFGITRKDDAGYVMEIVEKPALEELERLRGRDGTLRVSMNIFLFDYDMFTPFLERCPLHPQRHEKELVAAVTAMVGGHPRSVKALPLNEHVPDLTFKEDIPRVKEFLTAHFKDVSW